MTTVHKGARTADVFTILGTCSWTHSDSPLPTLRNTIL